MITIANKLNKKDSVTGLDVWYKTKINDVKYKKDKVTSVVGTDVSMGTSYTVLIPFSKKYLKYKEWKDSIRENYYTMSQGDYIFFDDLTEEITPSNIVKLKSQYECCEVRSIEEAKENGINTIQLRVSGV